MTTQAARLTPRGTGAIAVIAITGPNAWTIIAQLFRPHLDRPEVDTLHFGHFGAPPGDEVVLATFSDRFEIHCHGGEHVTRWLMEQIAARGATVVEWNRFMPDSPLQSLCRAALTNAPTLRTATFLLDQEQGALKRAIHAIVGELRSGNVNLAAAALQDICKWSRFGSHLTKPWRVAICGPPNVGKSSLINALAGYHRAIVTATPGTTRDVTTTGVAFDGWPVELLDTAGLRETRDALESAGIRLGRDAAAAADLVVWVIDGSQNPVPPPTEFAAALIVINKIDLAPATDFNDLADAVLVSATHEIGLDELIKRMVTRLIPSIPAPGSAIPITEELAADLVKATAICTSDPSGAGALLCRIVGMEHSE